MYFQFSACISGVKNPLFSRRQFIQSFRYNFLMISAAMAL